MTERLLQYIWQFQHFNSKELQLSTGESLQIIHPGQLNAHQGPDFLEASIKIDITKWIGNIELHVQTSDWFRHAHHHDKNYKNIILHVVWINDLENNMGNLPLLALADKVPKMLLNRYEEWMMNMEFVPCGTQLSTVSSIVWEGWKERLLIERLQRKTGIVESYLNQCNHHWEEAFWWLLAKNFGIKVNAEAFESVAKSLPVTVLVRHKNQINQLEALLLGQAGLLETKFVEDYPQMLQKEYLFYKSKYKLQSIREPIHFLRMRPENFPTIRLAQLAMLIHDSSHLFSKVIEMNAAADVKALLAVTANDYWHYHYMLDEPSPFKPKKLGEQMANNIIINTIVPVVFAFGFLHKKDSYQEKAFNWLEAIRAENNSVVDRFTKAGLTSLSALDTQAVLELKTSYCDKRRCLDCAVGSYLLRGIKG
jgi:Protein of unknown function (DUF2851)